jgi:predicted  nucleic acid-binding Zn-ribbon protein
VLAEVIETLKREKKKVNRQI